MMLRMRAREPRMHRRLLHFCRTLSLQLPTSSFRVRFSRMSSPSTDGATPVQMDATSQKNEKQLRKEAEKLAKKQAKMDKFAKKQETTKTSQKTGNEV